MSRIATLRANKDEAERALDALLATHERVLATRSLTAAEVAKQAEATARLASLEASLAEETKREADADAELRAGNRVPHITVGSEPLTYSEANPQNSWYRDMFYATTVGKADAKERLQRHQEEMDGLAKSTSQDRTVRSQRLAVRNYQREVSRRSESRATGTSTSSMGDFAPPLYFLHDYAPFRTYGRTLIDTFKKMPLPETGMTFNLPVVTTPTEAVNQGGDNTSITSRDMTASYATGTLQTIADNLIVSQQYLDRVGPGIGGDQIVRDDQNRQMNRTLNLYGWSQFYANAGGSANFAGSASFNSAIQALRTQIYGLKAAIRTTDGVVAYPTHITLDATVWEQLAASYDSQGRPFVVPSGQAFNPLAVGEEAAVPEGYSGYKFAELPVFVDEASWVQQNDGVGGGSSNYGGSGSNHVVAVYASDLFGYWLEGNPVVRVLPQPYANQLSVLIQQFSYVAFVPEYVGAARGLTGSQLADSIVTTW